MYGRLTTLFLLKQYIRLTLLSRFLRERQKQFHYMATPLAKAWSNRDHGTSTSNNVMILAQLLITEAGIATAAAYHTKIKSP